MTDDRAWSCPHGEGEVGRDLWCRLSDTPDEAYQEVPDALDRLLFGARCGISFTLVLSALLSSTRVRADASACSATFSVPLMPDTYTYTYSTDDPAKFIFEYDYSPSACIGVPVNAYVERDRVHGDTDAGVHVHQEGVRLDGEVRHDVFRHAWADGHLGEGRSGSGL